MKQDITYIIQDYEEKIAKIKGKKIVIFGAGLFLKPVIQSLKQLDVSICCICDNSETKQNKIIESFEVLSPLEASLKYPDAYYVISTYPKYIEEIEKQLTNLGVKNIIDAFLILAKFDYQNSTFPEGLSFIHFQIDDYFYKYFDFFHKEVLLIPSLDIVITEKCSLKCRDCSNLMQYYIKPKNFNFKEIFKCLNSFMEEVDFVLELRILGGEAFMNPEAYKFINELRKYKNYGRIVVYSNGTITPADENLKALKYDDTYLRISNYGKVSKKLDDMINLFDKMKINYSEDVMEGWQDCSKIKRQNRTKKGHAKVFEVCCANKTFTLMNSKIYNCPFAANVFNLNFLPTELEEALYIKESNEIRSEIYEMLKKRKYFKICEFCAGRPDDEIPLPVAIQVKKPLKFEGKIDE